jgi:GT2 family glycosyltransferase
VHTVKNVPKALVITVNFRQDQCTLRFLNSATKLKGFASCDFLIVNNHSEDNSAAVRRASAEFRNIELLESPQNGGYFGAANWALRYYLEGHATPEWVVVCNNDIVFNDSQFLLRLFENNPGALGMIAPSIISGLTGYDENPSIRHRPSRFRMLRYRLWLSNYYLMWFKQWLSPFVRRTRCALKQSIGIADRRIAKPIYAPSGSFLIFSRRFFEAGGFIDDGSFLYAEEFRVAEMCRYLRLPVIHDPGLSVWHEGGQSTGRMLTRSVYLHQKEGLSYAFARYERSYPELGTSAHTVRIGVPDLAPESRPLPAAGERVR